MLELTVSVTLCIIAGMGVLIEVPLMLWLVRICLRTQKWFPADAAENGVMP